MRILITGASGLLGSNVLLASIDAGYHVTATSHSRPIRASGAQWKAADLTVEGAAAQLLDDTQPEWVVHCAAATDVDRCEQDPDWAFALNRDMAAAVAAAAGDAGASMVHISTDAVFDGGPGPHREIDPTNPINKYGESKLSGERAVLAANPGAAVVRTNFYGWSPNGRTSLAEWFLGNLRAGEPCNGFTDIRFSPLLVNDLAQALFRILQGGASGIWHLGCTGQFSKYEFGVRIAEVFDLDPNLIAPVESHTVGLRAKRPKDLSLDSDKAVQELEIDLPPCDEGIRRFSVLEQGGYSDRLENLLAEPSRP
ncbi:MAG: dTDP-4-dehydrorhamnose reductase [Anaerolineae bacterium]|nr:MAG: dTDP-4-dehydrorhamnose reductase [Anaerolineae bacterium]